ncbi:TetR/AcrR family transcriptional regulator [uncultured Mycobacterium sp.]|uniref:TetR/AcrR family transcriptional regulator n=1 Tax=uncultured Mycobacterium sp. TaxID=171292 RepID=UPI0035CA3D99
MSVVSISGGDDGTVKSRLIRAADALIAEHGINAVQMDAVAKRAGVSRATAFRQLGSVSEVLMQVALLRAQRHIDAVHQLMQTKTGAFAKIEAALIYTARELPVDAAIEVLISRHSASVHDPRVHQAAVGVMGPVLQDGQRNGEIRTDITLDELVDFLVEQTYLAAEELDRTESAVRRRFRHFVAPALEARSGYSGEYLSRTREVEEALNAAMEALKNLARQLHAQLASDP